MMQSQGTVWQKLTELWGAIQDQAARFYAELEGDSPAWLKLAVLGLVLFLLFWVVVLSQRARTLDMERRAQQVRAQAAERNGLKLAPLGDNSLPDPRHGSDRPLWRNFFLLVGLVVLTGVLAHRQLRGEAGVAYSGPGPVYAGPVYPQPWTPQVEQTLWLEPRQPEPRAIQPASHRVIETRPPEQAATLSPEVREIFGGETVAPTCGGKPVSLGSARFFIRSEAVAGASGAAPEMFWAEFDRKRAAEARRYYETTDRPAMIGQFGAKSRAAAYSANNLAVALFHTGDCVKAESLFREARELAQTLGMPFADRMRIDQNYAHFRAIRAVAGGG
ncbi:hypothetical protein [Neomegalonema sp.]|uniref:hypothetical protein n=1 Tax=Neomegalonema sp. TaxID=2039713 RepID=UPI00262435CF|nr:hypothetical protein [Neomegalonema sp.]MDD2869095.1 hypothetical protein [Neomegalonema sp.]